MLRKMVIIVLAVPILLAPACSKKKDPGTQGVDDVRFAVEMGFDQSVIQTARDAASGRIEQLMGIDENFEETPVPALVFQVPGKNAEKPLFQLREKLSGTGCSAYIVEKNYGYSPDRIGVLKGTDLYEMIRYMGTNGINYDIENRDIINKLKQWESRYPFDMIAIGFDFLEAVFIVPPTDMYSFAREVYKFCPDVVDQGTGTVEALAAEMRRTGRLYLWWD